MRTCDDVNPIGLCTGGAARPALHMPAPAGSVHARMARRHPARRSRLLLSLFLAFLVAAPAVSAAAQSRVSRPNIVLIFADDLGYGSLSCYGNKEFGTPQLDLLASQGVRLTGFYVPTSGCAPSRATLLTGRYPFRSRMIRNPDPDFGLNRVGIPESELMLSEALKGAGYATSCIGKWHLGHLPRYYPRRHGFDEYFGILYSNSSRPALMVENEQVVEYPVVQANVTRQYTDRALRFIESNAGRPFFLYLAHSMPHYPLAASEDFYTPDTPDDLYADVIREMDHSVGRIVKKLDELRLAERTIVIFSSDNGPWYGGSTGGLRGMKLSAFEGGIRVPMIIRWIGRLPGGELRHQPCGTIDIFPTLLAAAGVQPPADRTLDGIDITEMLRNDAPLQERALFSTAGSRIASVRRGKWKLHVLQPAVPQWKEETFLPHKPDSVTIVAPFEQYPGTAFPGVRSGDPPKPMMLFDLESDPAEQHDVAGAHPDVVRRLMADCTAMSAQIPKDLAMPEAQPFRRVPGPGRITPDRPRPLAQVLGTDSKPK